MPKKGWVSFTLRSEVAEDVREAARNHCRTPQKQIQAWAESELGVVNKQGMDDFG